MIINERLMIFWRGCRFVLTAFAEEKNQTFGIFGRLLEHWLVLSCTPGCAGMRSKEHRASKTLLMMIMALRSARSILIPYFPALQRCILPIFWL